MIGRAMIAGVFTSAVLFGAPLAKGADCSHAKTRTDRAICGNPALSSQARLLAEQVAAVTAAVDNADADPSLAPAFAAQQKHWLAQRDAACAGSAACLLKQYRQRNLALAVLLDRVDGTALMDVTPILMTGRWTAPVGVAMLSAQDNRNGAGQKLALDQDPKQTTPPANYFPADAYRASGLPLPGGAITNTPDGQTCLQGKYLPPADKNLAIAAPLKDDGCFRFGWQSTNVQYIWQDMFGTNSVDGILGGAPSDTVPGWFVPPLLIEHDLNVGPDAPAYIAYRSSGTPDVPRAFMFVVQGKDGALYAPVTVPSTDPSQKTLNVAYQKWLPAGADARMVNLSP